MKKIVLFLTYNYPSRYDFFKILNLLNRENIYALEIGLPDENPYLDGETIKNINMEVIDRGFSYSQFEKDIKYIYKNYKFKTIIMGYKNSIDLLNLDYLKNYYHGIIVVDNKGYDKQIPLLSSEIIENIDMTEELEELQSQNPLFLYLISGAGKTGTFENLPTDYINSINLLKPKTNIPCLVGFGVKNRRDVEEVLKNGADGAIIGSSFIKKTKNYKDLEVFVKSLVD